MTNEIVTALVIPADNLPYLSAVKRDDRGVYEFISKTIDGFFDVVHHSDGTYHGYVHDEGLLIGLPINAVATALFGQVIVGTCLVFGANNPAGIHDGEEYDAPSSAITRTQIIAGAYAMWLDSQAVTR